MPCIAAPVPFPGMGEVAVEGIIGISVGERDGFIPEQKRSMVTTTSSSLAGWAVAYLRPVLARQPHD